jgi:hypothetical protein
VSLVWRLQNLGLGNLAEQREQRALHEQTILRQLQIRDQVMTQVVQAHEQVQQTRERLRITQSSLYTSSGAPDGPVYRSVLLNFQRVRGGEGRPLELLDSIRSLNDLLDSYSQAMTDYERARFRLLVALGLPSQGLLDPHLLPAPPRPCGATETQTSLPMPAKDAPKDGPKDAPKDGPKVGPGDAPKR